MSNLIGLRLVFGSGKPLQLFFQRNFFIKLVSLSLQFVMGFFRHRRLLFCLLQLLFDAFKRRHQMRRMTLDLGHR